MNIIIMTMMNSNTYTFPSLMPVPLNQHCKFGSCKISLCQVLEQQYQITNESAMQCAVPLNFHYSSSQSAPTQQ